MFWRAHIPKTSGSKDHSAFSPCLSPPTELWGQWWGFWVGWVTLALSSLSAAGESAGLPYQTSNRPARALYFMALSCVRSCPLGRSCQRKT